MMFREDYDGELKEGWFIEAAHQGNAGRLALRKRAFHSRQDPLAPSCRVPRYVRPAGGALAVNLNL